MSSACPPAGYRWIVLSIAFVAFFVTFLDRLAWASATGPASRSLGVPAPTLALFVTTFYSGYVVTSAVSGFAVDRLGSRRILVLTLGPLAVTTAMFGLTTSLRMGLVLQALMGMCAGADYAAAVKLVAGWFACSERGRALGLLSIAPSIGIAVAGALFPSVIAIVGWRVTYALLGALTALTALACFRGLPGAAGSTQTMPAENDVASLAWRRGLAMLARDRNLRLIALAGFGANWGTWGFAFWATTLMVSGYRLSWLEAGMVTAIFGGAAAVSKPLYGLLSDLLRSRGTLVVIDLAAFAAALIVFGLMKSKTGFLVTAPFLGLTAVAYSPLLAAMITETTPRSTTATATGVINALWQLGSVVVPVVVGAVFASTRSFEAAFGALAAGPSLGMLCALAIRENSQDTRAVNASPFLAK